MKKSILLIAAAVVCMMGFSACEGESVDISQLSGTDMLGHIYLTPSNQNDGFGGYHNAAIMSNDSVKFNSGLCCVKLNTTGVGVGVDELDLGTLFFGSERDVLVISNNEIQFPLIGINLRDTTPQEHNGNYAIHIPMVEGDFSFIDSLNENNWNYYLTNTNIRISGEPANIMVIAVSEDEFYVCYDGNIHIDEWATEGNRIQGQVQNVKAFRVTRESLPALLALPERATTLLSAYLPTVTLNGVISSPRMTSENVSVIEALDQLQ